jgi:ribosome biogenesis GTPase A
MNIQWYPGHMVKAKKLVREHLKLIDVVIELVDARVPISSRNPDIDKIVENKPRIVVLNKGDLADPEMSKEWSRYFKSLGYQAIIVNSITGQGIKLISKAAQELVKEKFAAIAAKGRRPRAIRGMIVGIPNVGKSSFINKLAGRTTARTGDRPGVTKGKQWIKIGEEFELLDTPGILWPKFQDPQVGFRLAFTGAISDAIMDIQTLATKLAEYLRDEHPAKLMSRYKLTELPEEPEEIIDKIAVKRGHIISGGRVDYLKTATMLIDEFRGGKLGLFTLDKLTEAEKAEMNNIKKEKSIPVAIEESTNLDKDLAVTNEDTTNELLETHSELEETVK